MKSKSRIILIAASVSLSLGVVSAMAREYNVDVILVEHSDRFEISKIEPFCPSAFVLKNYDAAALACSLDNTFAREYTILAYKQGKVNNKALPLSRKLWLEYCQFAFK